MGMLVEGEWVQEDEKYRNSESGAFVRPESIFRDSVTADGSWGSGLSPAGTIYSWRRIVPGRTGPRSFAV